MLSGSSPSLSTLPLVFYPFTLVSSSLNKVSQQNKKTLFLVLEVQSPVSLVLLGMRKRKNLPVRTDMGEVVTGPSWR